jgi:rubrerythrin
MESVCQQEKRLNNQIFQNIRLDNDMFEGTLGNMAKIELKVMGWKCERCGHEWIPKDEKKPPRVCPSCKSPYWDRPRRKDAEKRKSGG